MNDFISTTNYHINTIEFNQQLYLAIVILFKVWRMRTDDMKEHTMCVFRCLQVVVVLPINEDTNTLMNMQYIILSDLRLQLQRSSPQAILTCTHQFLWTSNLKTSIQINWPVGINLILIITQMEPDV